MAAYMLHAHTLIVMNFVAPLHRRRDEEPFLHVVGHDLSFATAINQGALQVEQVLGRQLYPLKLVFVDLMPSTSEADTSSQQLDVIGRLAWDPRRCTHVCVGCGPGKQLPGAAIGVATLHDNALLLRLYCLRYVTPHQPHAGLYV